MHDLYQFILTSPYFIIPNISIEDISIFKVLQLFSTKNICLSISIDIYFFNNLAWIAGKVVFMREKKFIS